MTGRILGYFDDVEDVRRQFSGSGYGREPDIELSDDEVVVAVYGDAYGYSGDAYVLFERDDRLMEAEGSHCSCYGLEGQWAPCEVNTAYLARKAEALHDLTGIEAEYAAPAIALILERVRADREWMSEHALEHADALADALDRLGKPQEMTASNGRRYSFTPTLRDEVRSEYEAHLAAVRLVVA